METLGAPSARYWRRIAEPVLLCLLLLSLSVIALYALNRPVSFDGAMNLQVAQSLAEGRGYVRDYDGARAFPIEVQTNVPFIVPAAAVFAAFGVGLLQSQIVNFAYMLAFLVLLIQVGRRFDTYLTGLLCALAVIVVPGFYWIGMNGWGELVALFWWLAGTVLLLRERSSKMHLLRCAGGICLGLALATKTVMLIGVAATAAVYMLWVLPRGRTGWGAAIRGLLLAAACVAVPLVLVEIWRLHALGTPGYVNWWAEQFKAITFQTGVLDAGHPPGGSKLVRHFAALSSQTRLPGWLLAPWLLVPIAGSAIVLASAGISSELKRIWSAILLVVIVFLVWWLMVTPDSHVRLRRIEIALILNQFLAVMHLAVCVRFARQSRPWAAMGVAGAVVLAIASALFANDAIVDLRKRWDSDTSDFDRIIATVKALPASEKLFGKGFLSSPTVALYAARRVDDIDRYTAGQLAAMRSGYIMIDGAASKDRRFAPELLRYRHAPVLDIGGFKIVRLDFTTRLDPFAALDLQSVNARTWVDFRTTNTYPWTFGLQASHAAKWRWARTDADIVLKFTGEPRLVLLAYKPDKTYLHQRPLLLTASVDGCRLGSRELPAGQHEVAFTIPAECRPSINGNVRVQVEADNLLLPSPRDLRQHSYVLSAIGFRD